MASRGDDLKMETTTAFAKRMVSPIKVRKAYRKKVRKSIGSLKTVERPRRKSSYSQADAGKGLKEKLSRINRRKDVNEVTHGDIDVNLAPVEYGRYLDEERRREEEAKRLERTPVRRKKFSQVDLTESVERSETEADVGADLRHRRVEKRYVYKYDGNRAMEINDNDMRRLESVTFLNDTLVNFYIQYLIDNASDEFNDRCFVFNSYFYANLKNHGYDRIKSITSKKNVDIFKKDFVFVPIVEQYRFFYFN